VKRRILIISGLIILGIIFVLLRNENSFLNNNKNSSSQLTPTPIVSFPVEEHIQELEFTQEQLEQYYEVYKNPYVLHVRKALNGYLKGTNEGIEFPESVIEAHTLEKAPSESGIENADSAPAGLDSFSKDYYQSKFVVMAINDGVMGGKIINIIFQDRPDKLFDVWIYQMAEGDYDFRGIWQNINFTGEKLDNFVKSYKKYIEDKEHSL
jgi:hypothetical protein